MIAERGQRVAGPDAGVAQVYIIVAGHAAVDRAGAGIGTGRAGFDLHRHALHDEVGGDQGGEGAGQARADVGEAAVDEAEDLLTAIVVVGEEIARILAHGGHAFADRAFRHAQLFEQAVHFGLQRGELGKAELVDFVGRHGRGGAGFERPGIISVAVTEFPDARIHGCLGALALEFGDLRGEGGGDGVADDLRGLGSIVAGHVLRAAGDGGDGDLLVDRLRLDRFHLAQRLVEQEGGGDHAEAGVMLQAFGFAIQVRGIELQAGQIGVGVGAAFDAMVAVEEIGGFDEAAGILRHGIGAVAIGPVAVHDRHVAKGEGEAFRRGFMRGQHHFHIDAGRGRERGEVDGAQPGEAILHMGGDLRLTRRRLVAEAAFERGSGAGVDAKAARRFGGVGQHRFGHVRQQGLRGGIRAGGGSGRGTGRKGAEGDGGGAGCEQRAAGGQHGGSLRWMSSP